MDGPAAVDGELRLRSGTPDDAVDGAVPASVAAPGSVAELSGLLRGTGGQAVVAKGAGTKLGWGRPPERLDLLVELAGLDAMLDYNPGDLVVSAAAGVPLRRLQAEVGGHGQQLALDPVEPGATLGGIVAANASGPRRHRYGTVRDLLIGVTVVLADGTVARAGGTVVKNVAGYDLGKLYTGSFGTLGVVAETTWRLHPLPPARRVVVFPVADGGLVQRLLHSPLTPTAIELIDGQLVVVFESIEPSVAAQAEQAAALGDDATLADELPDGFGARAWSAGMVGCTLSVVVSAFDVVLAAVRRLAPEVRLGGRAGLGVLELGLSDPDPGLLTALRAAVASYDGTLVVREAPASLKAAVDVWGPVGDALPLMRRVKERFDPGRRLAPGRFVGGI